MTKEYEHKGHKITFNEASADFSLTINGRRVRSTSLEGAKRQIEKYAIKEFKHVDVLMVDYDKKGDSILKKVTLEKYEESRSYGSRDLERYAVTSEGKKIHFNNSWGIRGRIFPLSARAKVEPLLKEKNKQDDIRQKAEENLRGIKKSLEEATLDMATIDPKSSK